MSETQEQGGEQPDQSTEIPWGKLLEGEVRKGYDQLVDTKPEPAPMTPQDAVEAADPRSKGTKE